MMKKCENGITKSLWYGRRRIACAWQYINYWKGFLQKNASDCVHNSDDPPTAFP